jgi:hypothetical protein
MEKIQNQQNLHFAICLNNEGYEVSLERGKLYSMLPDEQVEQQGLIRIIDESGEEYAFSLNRFHPIQLPIYIEKISMAPVRTPIR